MNMAESREVSDHDPNLHRPTMRWQDSAGCSPPPPTAARRRGKRAARAVVGKARARLRSRRRMESRARGRTARRAWRRTRAGARPSRLLSPLFARARSCSKGLVDNGRPFTQESVCATESRCGSPGRSRQPGRIPRRCSSSQALQGVQARGLRGHTAQCGGGPALRRGGGGDTCGY